MKTIHEASGMGKTVPITVKLPEEYRRKLRIVAAMRGTSLKELLAETIDKIFEEAQQNQGVTRI